MSDSNYKTRSQFNFTVEHKEIEPTKKEYFRGIFKAFEEVYLSDDQGAAKVDLETLEEELSDISYPIEDSENRFYLCHSEKGFFYLQGTDRIESMKIASENKGYIIGEVEESQTAKLPGSHQEAVQMILK